MARVSPEPIQAELVARAVASGSAGAALTFSGTVRNEHRGRKVTGIEYHAYASMATKELARIEEEISSKWPGSKAAIQHRVGLLAVGETSVAIAVSTAHRAEGFDALRFAIEAIKRMAPIWKKEMYADGGHEWIEGS